MDLVCLVADRSIEAAVQAMLGRPKALGIRPITFETLVHPERDPGCFHDPGKLLGGYVERADHALVVLDRAWEGAPSQDASDLEDSLERELKTIGHPTWARAVVIDPELEVWVFSDSPHVAAVIGWPGSMEELRAALEAESLWDPRQTKPRDPKRALEWVLRKVGQPRSSVLFRSLGSSVSLRRCHDRSFVRLLKILREWFAARPIE